MASNEKVAGQYQAEYIADYFKNKNNIKVVLLKGEKNHVATKGRTKAVKETFKEKGIDADYFLRIMQIGAGQKLRRCLIYSCLQVENLTV
ncbi:ABC-type sugar transport system substrate-binding protein [Clostridium beijerinckii]|uniref:hypothetical protein n=1 Tax=Clostridium beijerinckii TaxID=1520 RepID=UPI001F4C1069|nr:hypothetical protein [Clostridium beijerinckii]NRZ82606.1 ABC-type sugar transport system substrate-binding protein [Clostridium beijerinckii]